MQPRRLGGAVVAATGLVCPCHVLAGLVVGAATALGVGGPGLSLSPALQDAVHGVYLPAAVVTGAALLSGVARGRRSAARPRGTPG